MRIVAITAAAVLVAWAPACLADKISGHNILTNAEPVETQLANGKTYVSVSNHHVMQTDKDHPLNRAAGDCSGACIVDEMGNQTCMGSCSIADAEGDMAFFSWSGFNEGTWKLLGGSGKYAEAEGSGTWNSAATYVGNMAGNDWEGEITMR